MSDTDTIPLSPRQQASPFRDFLNDDDGDAYLQKAVPTGRYRELEPGVYTAHSDMSGTYLRGKKIEYEPLIELPDSEAQQVSDYITTFYDPETKERYERYEFLYKAGMLLHGKPGTGKTYICYQVAEQAVANGDIVLWDPDPRLVPTFVRAIRAITDKDVRILVIWEEFDRLLDRQENTILQLLDGGDAISNIVYLATTNYYWRLPQRISNRPSRFIFKLEIGPPPAVVRRAYFERKLHPVDQDKYLDALTDATEGLVLDHCKALMLEVVVMQRDLKTVADRLKKENGVSTDTVADGLKNAEGKRDGTYDRVVEAVATRLLKEDGIQKLREEMANQDDNADDDADEDDGAEDEPGDSPTSPGLRQTIKNRLVGVLQEAAAD